MILLIIFRLCPLLIQHIGCIKKQIPVKESSQDYTELVIRQIHQSIVKIRFTMTFIRAGILVVSVYNNHKKPIDQL